MEVLGVVRVEIIPVKESGFFMVVIEDTVVIYTIVNRIIVQHYETVEKISDVVVWVKVHTERKIPNFIEHFELNLQIMVVKEICNHVRELIVGIIWEIIVVIIDGRVVDNHKPNGLSIILKIVLLRHIIVKRLGWSKLHD